MRKNAFTLIELLSVIVIFVITFLIVLPTMNLIIGSSEKREIELIEQRVLSVAKEYVNNFDGTFYKNFYNAGDTSYVYKSDLKKSGLIDENEISNMVNKNNLNNVFLQTYPVVSIYVTNDSANPGTKFGGTWVVFGAGRTLVGVDSLQTEFATVGFTGGEKRTYSYNR